MSRAASSPRWESPHPAGVPGSLPGSPAGSTASASKWVFKDVGARRLGLTSQPIVNSITEELVCGPAGTQKVRDVAWRGMPGTRPSRGRRASPGPEGTYP